MKTLLKTIDLNHGRTLKVYSSGWVRLFRSHHAPALCNYTAHSPYYRNNDFRGVIKVSVKAGQPMPDKTDMSQPMQHYHLADVEAALKFADDFAEKFNSRYPENYFV